MDTALIAAAIVLAAIGAAFVVWVWRTDKALQKLTHDRQHKNYRAMLKTPGKLLSYLTGPHDEA